MEDNQKINCSVATCRYNNRRDQVCQLKEIVVTPIYGVETKQSDESMCSSYQNVEKKSF